MLGEDKMMQQANTSTNETTGISHVTLGYSLLGIDLLIILLNTVAICVISRFKHKNAIDIFVLALATSDFFKGLIPVPITVYIYLSDWYLVEGSAWCNFYGWIAFTTNSGSMLILTLMAIERFLAIVKPLYHRSYVTTDTVRTAVVVAVLFSGLQSALPLVGVGRMWPYYKGAYCHFDYSNHSNGTVFYSIFIIAYGFAMNIVVFVSYVIVFYKIRNLISRHKMMATKLRNNAKWNLKTEKMFSYLTLVLMVLFSFTWLPFLIVVLSAQIGFESHLERLDLFAMRIAVVNSMLNPLAYAILCKPYRRGVAYLFKRCFAKKGVPDRDLWVLDPWSRKSVTNHSSTGKVDDTLLSIAEDMFPDSVFAVIDRSRRPSELAASEKRQWKSKKKKVKVEKEVEEVLEDDEDEVIDKLIAKSEKDRKSLTTETASLCSENETEKRKSSTKRPSQTKIQRLINDKFAKKHNKTLSVDDLFSENNVHKEIQRRNTLHCIEPITGPCTEDENNSDRRDDKIDIDLVKRKGSLGDKKPEGNTLIEKAPDILRCKSHGQTGYNSSESMDSFAHINSVDAHPFERWAEDGDTQTTTLSSKERPYPLLKDLSFERHDDGLVTCSSRLIHSQTESPGRS